MTTPTVASPDADTYEQRIDRYATSVRRCAYVGGGFGGVLVLLAVVGESSGRWWWVTALIVTLVAVGGACLGRSYIDFEIRGSELRRSVLADPATAKTPAPRYPMDTLNFSRASMVLLVLAGILMLVRVWLPA